MPIQDCTKDGQPGYQYGDEGFCYTYTNETSQVEAKRKAIMQGVAIERERGGEVHE